MGRSTVSRRVSEFVGVALFAAALIWIVALASYEPSDPVWFFSTGTHGAPANFAGRVGAFLAELSFQLFGYASYLIPAVMVIIGWNYFWCRSLDAAGTKAIGAVLLFACISAFLSLIFGTLQVSGKSFRAGGYAGEFLATELSEYLNRTGSLIVILTLIFLAIIMSTQFSFGRFFAAMVAAIRDSAMRSIDAFREWREERRREKQRREVIAKHTKKGTVVTDAAAPPRPPAAEPAPVKAAKRATRAPPTVAGHGLASRRACRARRPRLGRSRPPDQPAAPQPAIVAPPLARAERERAAAAAAPATAPRSFAPPKPPKVVDAAAAAARSGADREGAGRAPQGRLHAAAAALLDAREDRAQDRRARADGRGAAARGEVPRVLGRRLGRADPSGPGRHDLRVQAGRRREVLEDHRPRRRPLPRDEGRLGPHRSHPRQVHRRHPDSEPHARADLAARAARVGRLPALDVEADHRARQDDSRRAVHGRSRDDAAPADRRVDRRRQVGRHQRHADQHPLPRHAGRRADDHDRSEAARARDVRGHPAPDDAGRRRSEAGGQRAALGGARDGGALQDARRGRRPQHRAVQPQRPAGDRGEAHAQGRQGAASRSPSSSSSSTSSPT